MTSTKNPLSSAAWPAGATLLCLALCVQVAAAQTRPERNAFLSADIYGVTHINPAKQNSIPYKINLRVKKVDLDALTPVWGGPVNNSTYASARPGFFWSVATDRVALIDARGGQWKKVADIDLPGATRRSRDALQRIVKFKYSDMPSAEAHLKGILGPATGAVLPAGIYALVSHQDYVYANAGTIVSAIGLVDRNDASKGLEVRPASILPPSSRPPACSARRREWGSWA
ncbi:MAG: hypothetical protein ACK5VP_09625 [Betaproteobacteria bacterium]